MLQSVELSAKENEQVSAVVLPPSQDATPLVAQTQTQVTVEEPAQKCNEFESASSFKIFRVHLIALLKKRVIYGKRDRRMFLCQLVIPVCLMVLGLSLLLVLPNYNQPDLTLSSSYFNPALAQSSRNFVPFLISRDSKQSSSVSVNSMRQAEMAQKIQSKFDGGSVEGVAVPLYK